MKSDNEEEESKNNNIHNRKALGEYDLLKKKIMLEDLSTKYFKFQQNYKDIEFHFYLYGISLYFLPVSIIQSYYQFFIIILLGFLLSRRTIVQLD